MAQAPLLIRFRGRARPQGKTVTAAPPATPPAKPVAPAQPPTAKAPTRRSRSILYRYLEDNTAALRVAGGGQATGDALANIAKASADQAAASGMIVAALNDIKGALDESLTLGEDERKIIRSIADELKRVTEAIDKDQGEPSVGAAAMLTIAIGAQGHRSQAREAEWLGAAKFDTLTDIASVTAEEFADRMLAAREGDLLLSNLVATATRSTLLFMHAAAVSALDAIPVKKKKVINPPPAKM